MRSSAVAPAPLPKQQRESNGVSKSFSSPVVVAQQEMPNLTEGAARTPAAANPLFANVSTSEPPPLRAAASSSMEDDTIDSDEEGGFSPQDDDGSMSPDDDPYTYSDDSASLNDAYFLQPPHDSSLGNGSAFGLVSDTESEKDPLESPSGNGVIYTMDYVPAATPFSHKKRQRDKFLGRRGDRHKDRSTSVSSPIDEDEPVTESTFLLRNKDSRFANNHTGVITSSSQPGTTSVSSYRNRQERKRRKLRKQQRNIRLKQQQQEERERAVSQIRGQPQPATLNDRFWLALFVVQLLYVTFVAMKYGISLLGPSVTTVSAPGSALASITGMYSERIPPTLPFAQALDSTSSLDTSNTASLPYDHGQDTPGTTSSQSNTLTVADGISQYLEDDDNIHPAVPDDHHPNLRSKNKSKDPSSSTTSSSSSGTTTITTTHMDGSSVIVVENAPFTVDYKNVLSLLLISGLYAAIISYLSFAFMLMVARSLIPIMLIFTIMLLLCWGLFGLTVTTYGGSAIALLGFALFGLSLAYTMQNWNRIPFCSTNLYTAICALRSSIMIILAGVISLFATLLWLFVWSIALMGILNTGNGADCAMWDECDTHVVIKNGRLMEVGVLLISLYWTTMVIKNIVRVTVADAVGCWWMQIDGTLFGPLIRSCTTSLGTICFGSLVAFPAQVLSMLGGCLCWTSGGLAKKYSFQWAPTPTKRMSSSSEHHGADDTKPEDFSEQQKEVANAVAKKIAEEKNCLRRFGRQLQACNRWSYTYIGMYNYSFIEGGKKAVELFETREWMEIVRDNLIQNILVMASIVIGGSSAAVAVLVEEVDGYMFTSLHKPVMTSFGIGFILGFILSNILLLGVVGSAVNTILVCFAAEPFQFDRHHPHLSREMREVWSQQVWEPEPGS
ncbi:plasma-membrane choline transporter family protein [Nitzschia inconspicua]|uniref:Plasma-membrane choline transporter family protein n=1 Tax=Nitzschia inconspicua TaxID=303405 RepID=A0A9K3LUE4_9STRA|nr:plasma-membrane choline transporter family protein [Nitzschia inconspicua]